MQRIFDNLVLVTCKMLLDCFLECHSRCDTPPINCTPILRRRWTTVFDAVEGNSNTMVKQSKKHALPSSLLLTRFFLLLHLSQAQQRRACRHKKLRQKSRTTKGTLQLLWLFTAYRKSFLFENMWPKCHKSILCV